MEFEFQLQNLNKGFMFVWNPFYHSLREFGVCYIAIRPHFRTEQVKHPYNPVIVGSYAIDQDCLHQFFTNVSDDQESLNRRGEEIGRDLIKDVSERLIRGGLNGPDSFGEIAQLRYPEFLVKEPCGETICWRLRYYFGMIKFE